MTLVFFLNGIKYPLRFFLFLRNVICCKTEGIIVKISIDRLAMFTGVDKIYVLSEC